VSKSYEKKPRKVIVLVSALKYGSLTTMEASGTAEMAISLSKLSNYLLLLKSALLGRDPVHPHTDAWNVRLSQY